MNSRRHKNQSDLFRMPLPSADGLTLIVFETAKALNQGKVQLPGQGLAGHLGQNLAAARSSVPQARIAAVQAGGLRFSCRYRKPKSAYETCNIKPHYATIVYM